MRPVLFEIPLPDWSWLPAESIPVRGYGAMLALGFLVAILIAAWRSRREGENPDHIYNIAILALLGGVIGARLFDVIEYAGTAVRNESGAVVKVMYDRWQDGLNVFSGIDPLWLVLGAAAGAALALAGVLPWGRKDARIRWAAVGAWAAALALIAGRGMFIRAHSDQYAGFIDALQITSGGLTVYGGVMLALGLVVPYLIYLHRRHGVNPLKMADITAPSLAIGLAFGRMGCFLNGCCYGAPSDLPWCFTWPQGTIPFDEYVLKRGCEVMPHLHPAQLYGVVNGLLLFLVLHLGFRWKKRHGVVIGAFFGLYAISRILLEAVRSDEPKHFMGGMSISQVVGLFALVGVALYFLWLRRSRLARLDWQPPRGAAEAGPSRAERRRREKRRQP